MRAISPRPQLITYPDSLGGDLSSLGELLAGPFEGLFKGVHILPPFPSSADRGFAPTTYDEIDPRFGTWTDITEIAEHHDVMLDLMINHLSRRSPEFRDFERNGRASAWADLFITLDKVWPAGLPPAADVSRIFLRRPDHPFSAVTIQATGAVERVWTSFGAEGWSEQVDLDVTSPVTRSLIQRWLRTFADRGVGIIRLDAVGYVIKKPGTSCFMVEPEISEFLRWIADEGSSVGATVLPEIHDRYATHERLADQGFWTYDFVLPGLVLHSFETCDASRLASHLARSPDRQFTTLDCHDGIPVRPDLDGILGTEEMRALAAGIERHGGNVNRLLSTADPSEVDVHQLNATYYSALGCDDDRYLAARAIQLFAKGVPQVYYVGMLAGENDQLAVEQTGDGRAINRHDYPRDELVAALGRPVVRRLMDLVRFRNSHPAFDGALEVRADGPNLWLRWRNGDACCTLEVDIAAGRASISDADGNPTIPV